MRPTYSIFILFSFPSFYSYAQIMGHIILNILVCLFDMAQALAERLWLRLTELLTFNLLLPQDCAVHSRPEGVRRAHTNLGLWFRGPGGRASCHTPT